MGPPPVYRPMLNQVAGPAACKPNIPGLLQPKVGQISKPMARTSGVIQRLVPLGLKEGTEVIIIRSTSNEFHGEHASILGPGEQKNEYLVQVTKTQEKVYARADQLKLTTDISRVQKPVNVDFSEISGKSDQEILGMVRELVKKEINPKKEFAVGGSFAAFLHALKANQPARTPRDIDIILDKDDFFSRKPVERPDITFCGIPLELHTAGQLVTPTEQEMLTGIIAPETLLSKHVKKLRDQQFKFRAAIPKDVTSAKKLLEIMQTANDDLMNMQDGNPNHMSDVSKKVWMKTLADIEALAALEA